MQEWTEGSALEVYEEAQYYQPLEEEAEFFEKHSQNSGMKLLRSGETQR